MVVDIAHVPPVAELAGAGPAPADGTANGVAVFAPDGTPLGKIDLPEATSNLVFGGPNRNRLFMTATSSVYALYVAVRGNKTV